MSKGTAFVAVVVSFALGWFLRGFSSGGTAGEEGATAVIAAPGEGGDRTRVPVGLSPSKGPREAKVTIVEFSDFQ